MNYRWRVPTEVEVFHAIPANRYLITAAGGYFPLLDHMSDGRVAAVVREGDFHVGQRGRLSLVVSGDGGESWSESLTIVHAAQDPCHTAFGVAGNGTLLVSYVLPHAYNDGQWNRTVMPTGPVLITRSADDGETWSRPEQINTSSIDAPHINPYGRIVRLADDTLLMPIYVNWANDGGLRFDELRDTSQGSYILRSRDDGRTWDDASMISGDELGETSLALLPSGGLLAALRSGRDSNMWVSKSEDAGYTWSNPRPVTGQNQAPGDLVVLKDGRLLMVFGHRNVPYGVRGLISYDEGVTWDHHNTLILASESVDRDCGYPKVLQVEDGHVVVAYYVHQSPGPFVNSPDKFGGPYAAAVKFHAGELPKQLSNMGEAPPAT